MSASGAGSVVLGALIGAGGAVIAQVASSVFTGRRESKRFAWEQGKQERDWEMREAERFLHVKQDLYSRYLSQASRVITHAYWVIQEPDVSDPEEPADFAELRSLRWNITLLGSTAVDDSVANSFQRLLSAGQAADSPNVSAERRLETAHRAREAWQAAIRVMRADLFGDQELIRFGRTGEPKREKQPPDPPAARAGSRWRPKGWWRAIRRSA
jgi:hypothetical protein